MADEEKANKNQPMLRLVLSQALGNILRRKKAAAPATALDAPAIIPSVESKPRRRLKQLERRKKHRHQDGAVNGG